MCSEPKEEAQKPLPPLEAAKHHCITAVCLAVARYEPAPPKMFREGQFYLIIFCCEHIPKKGTFQEHIPFENIPIRAHCVFIIFHFKHIPKMVHSKKGHFPEQFWSLQPLVQANAGSSKSARRGAAAAADKSISSYPRSQSSRVPMRSAEGWSQLLFDRCGLLR